MARALKTSEKGEKLRVASLELETKTKKGDKLSPDELPGAVKLGRPQRTRQLPPVRQRRPGSLQRVRLGRRLYLLGRNRSFARKDFYDTRSPLQLLLTNLLETTERTGDLW